MAALAALNLLLAVLTGGRMGIVACFVLALAWVWLAGPLSIRGGRLASGALGLATAAVLLLLSVTLVEGYHLGDLEGVFSLTGRDTLWLHYLDQLLASPLFGRGLGAGLLGRSYYDLPHNEYLRLLVEGGICGFVLFGGAVVLWGREVVARIAPAERAFAGALLIALAVYALTDNILTMPAGLVPFVYLALLLGEPAAAAPLSGAPQASPAPAAPRGDLLRAHRAADEGQVAARHRVVAPGCQLEPQVGLDQVRRDAHALGVHPTKVILGIGIALLGRQSVEAQRQRRVLRHALAEGVEAAEPELRLGLTLLRERRPGLARRGVVAAIERLATLLEIGRRCRRPPEHQSRHQACHHDPRPIRHARQSSLAGARR